jgi:hypothetical protein
MTASRKVFSEAMTQKSRLQTRPEEYCHFKELDSEKKNPVLYCFKKENKKNPEKKYQCLPPPP